ncbi:DJ-1 family protein [Sphaerochaeta pleomorpha str. Grapes]|uniref:DJ-1 family protein n=1 Tax=Sphaerochaeta pleomorpha (strain ATCC BAA-1885 / DSM 22778 / Grapes) TaxID=158190 RepID=G8QR73_SPHPG|nr:DJ-1 family glyoxalase III [Sphaerochaeta pleomorpha]AEV31008.1 DJ-1 family protein [Sphaerochaeta pleomorpha str. Grapes]
MVPSVLVILANGFEEIEAITPIDMLRRSGANVTVAGLDNLTIIGSHKLEVTCDALLSDCKQTYDCVVCPGGSLGSKNLASSFLVLEKCIQTAEKGVVASICAATAVVLGKTGLLDNHTVTGYPGTEKECPGLVFSSEKVVTDRNLVTAQGAGCAMEFSLAIIAKLFDSVTAGKLSRQVLFQGV